MPQRTGGVYCDERKFGSARLLVLEEALLRDEMEMERCWQKGGPDPTFRHGLLHYTSFATLVFLSQELRLHHAGKDGSPFPIDRLGRGHPEEVRSLLWPPLIRLYSICWGHRENGDPVDPFVDVIPRTAARARAAQEDLAARSIPMGSVASQGIASPASLLDRRLSSPPDLDEDTIQQIRERLVLTLPERQECREDWDGSGSRAEREGYSAVSCSSPCSCPRRPFCV